MNINMYRFTSLFALVALAVAQPIFDQYSKNIEFFVAWDISGFELFLIVVTIYILIPALVIGGLIIAYRANYRLGFASECLFVTIFVSAFYMQLLKQLDMQNPLWIIFSTILFSIITVTIYFKNEIVRKFLVYLSITTVLFPLLFIQSLYSSSYFDAESDSETSPSVDANKADIPVVLIVYDEFPLTTLLDSSGLIDKERFPMISRFAIDSAWYINAETLSGETNIAVPSIISGIAKDHGTPPNFTNYPNNLFSLLRNTHKLNIIESGTGLCPPDENCQQKIKLRNKALGLVYDTCLIYLHLTIPKLLAKNITSVSFKTHDFGNMLEEKNTDIRIEKHKKFLSLIEGSGGSEPPLFFLHNVIPHVSWMYQPSGKKYYPNNSIAWAVPGVDHQDEMWTNQDWLVVQGYQRHILQTMYVDKMVGEILNSLKKKDLYDKSLIILTADHGASFWPNESRRGVKKNPRSDIFGVPLFIKYPNSERAGVFYESVKTTDIFPTIADVLDLKIPFQVIGNSLLGSKSRYVTGDAAYNNYVDSLSLKRKIDLFGDGDLNGIYQIGKYGDMVGGQVKKNYGISDLMGSVHVENMHLYSDVHIHTDFIPSLISGIISINFVDKMLQLAIAVNDVICGVTETYPYNGDLRFSSLVSEDCFLPGKNDIKILEISEDGKETLLAFSDEGKGGEFGVYGSDIITLNSGEVLHKSKIDGSVDVFSYDKNTRLLHVAGWAADLAKGRPVKYVLYRIGDAVYPVSSFPSSRSDIAKEFDNDILTNSGFEFYVPVKQLSDREFDIIAVSEDGKFHELSTATFSEKMPEKELRMFGLYEQHSEFGVYRNNTITLNSGEVLHKSKMDGNIEVFSSDENTRLLQVAGWSADLSKGRPAKYVLYRIGDTVYSISSHFLQRPDVADAFKNKGLTNSGFRFYVPMKHLSGREFDIFAVNENGGFDALSTARFSEKMSENELKMFGLHRHSEAERRSFFSSLLGGAAPGMKTEAVGAYSKQGIVLNSGETLVESGALLEGHVDIFTFDKSTKLVDVSGWAANTEAGEPAKYVLYRVDNEVFYGSPVSLDRPDVAKTYNNPSLSVTGFRFNIPSTSISGESVVEIISVMPNGKYKRISTNKFASTLLDIK